MTQVVIYARYSPRPVHSDEQKERVAADDDASTIKLQIEAAERYATMKCLMVTEIIRDVETSARKVPLFEREGGSRLKALPRGSHVIASTLDRMFRDTVDGLLALQHFESSGVHLHFADVGGCTLDVTSADGKFLTTVLLGVAAREPHRTAERTSAAYAHRTRSGQRMCAADCVPLGKRVDPTNPDRVVDCPDELAILDEVRTLSESGRGLRGICRAMEVKGVKLRDAAWHPTTIKRILRRSA